MGDCCPHERIMLEESMFEGEWYGWRQVCSDCAEVMACGEDRVAGGT